MNLINCHGGLATALLVSLGLFISCEAIQAADAPTNNPSDAGTAAQGDVIRLDEFTVNEEQGGGYRAANSITATGIGARIMDVPIPINVLTKDFIQDTNITDLRDAMEYVPGVITNPRNESEYSVRGFTGNISYRNGQYRRQNYTAWNMDRVEVHKGPAAVFYGSVRDGGVINYLTTRPVLDRSFTDVSLEVGTEDHYKFGIFHNLPVNDGLAFRFGFGFLDRHGKPMFDYRRENYYGASMLWNVNENHRIILDLEKVHRNNYMVSSRGYSLSHSDYLFNPDVPLIDANGTAHTTREWLDSQGRDDEPAYNIFAPIYPEPGDPYGRYFGFSEDSFEKFRSHAVDLEYIGKLGEGLVWQTNLNYGYDDQPGMRSNNGDRFPLADGSVLFRFERWRNIRDSYNAKNKLTWRFNVGQSQHTLQAGHEYQKVVARRPGWLNPDDNSFNSSQRTDFIRYNPRTDPPLSGFEQMELAGQEFNVTRKGVERLIGYYAVMQSRFFANRLHLLYGIRGNQHRNTANTYDKPVSNPGSDLANRVRPKGWTPQYGILYQPTPDISLFAVHSESIQPNNQIDADGNTADPRETTGVDVGVKTSLYGGRVVSTLTYYTLDKTNLTTRDTQREIETGRSPWYFYGNTNSSEGIELDLNLAPTDSYQVVLGWSHVIKSEVTESSNPALIGRVLTYTPEDTLSIWNRYQFSTGSLAGVTVALGGRYHAAARMTGDPDFAIVLPSYTVFDLMLSQRFRAFDRDIKAQLNIKNLFDKVYRTGSLGHFAEERSIILSFSTRL